MSKKSNSKTHLRVAGVAAIVSVVGIGCTSTTSTIMQRLDSNEFVGNSNGKTKPCHSAKPFKGIPTTVSIPTHVDIRIKETLYFDKAKMTPIVLSSRHLSAETEVIYSDKLISVDPKRPASGTLNYTLDFPSATGVKPEDYDKYQHIKKIGYDVKDDTIQTITKILTEVVPKLGLKPATKGMGETRQSEANLPASIDEVVRTVAWKRFDLNAPDLEACIAEFAASHMNNCDYGSDFGCPEPHYPTGETLPDGSFNAAPDLYPTQTP